jgi:hypothetical protein
MESELRTDGLSRPDSLVTERGETSGSNRRVRMVSHLIIRSPRQGNSWRGLHLFGPDSAVAAGRLASRPERRMLEMSRRRVGREAVGQ